MSTKNGRSVFTTTLVKSILRISRPGIVRSPKWQFGADTCSAMLASNCRSVRCPDHDTVCPLTICLARYVVACSVTVPLVHYWGRSKLVCEPSPTYSSSSRSAITLRTFKMLPGSTFLHCVSLDTFSPTPFCQFCLLTPDRSVSVFEMVSAYGTVGLSLGVPFVSAP